MRTLIVDDEAPARERLRALLVETGGIDIVGEADNGLAALEMAARDMPNLVLLDIRMPGMDGLEAARHMAGLEPAPAVIFTTAYSEHALAAFEAHAIDYLLKPVRKARLAQALQRARQLSAAQLNAYRHTVAGAPSPRTHLSACSRGRVELVNVRDIRYFQAGDKYVAVCHGGGEILIDDPLKALEEEFSQRFVRIHRSTLAARDLISGLEKDHKGHYYVRLAGGERLAVSRRHVSHLRSVLRTGHTQPG